MTLGYLKQTLNLDDALIFLLNGEDETGYYFRILPVQPARSSLALTKNSTIMQRLVQEVQALAQYNIDISPQFRNAPAQELQALKALNLEWFVPIQK